MEAIFKLDEETQIEAQDHFIKELPVIESSKSGKDQQQEKEGSVFATSLPVPIMQAPMKGEGGEEAKTFKEYALLKKTSESEIVSGSVKR